MPKPIELDLPYPSIDCVTEDLKSAAIIAPAYAGMHGELTAVLQYIYHTFYFEKDCEIKTAEVLEGIAVAEMHHMDMLGGLLLNLGVDPVYTVRPPYKCNFYNTSCISYSKTVQKMLMDDLSGEIYAVETYGKMLCDLRNEQVAAVIARIKLDEELHIKILRNCLEKLNCRRH